MRAALFYAGRGCPGGANPGAERNGPRMDGIYHELSRKTDPAKLLGYLNFSDGRPDAKFQKGLAEAFGFLIESGDAAPWVTIPSWLTQACGELAASGSAAFREVIQARGVI